jgi:hypothetical protein
MVREIRRMRLDHIALLSPSGFYRSAYPLARVRSCKPEEESREMIRLLLDTRGAVGDLGII